MQACRGCNLHIILDFVESEEIPPNQSNHVQRNLKNDTNQEHKSLGMHPFITV